MNEPTVEDINVSNWGRVKAEVRMIDGMVINAKGGRTDFESNRGELIRQCDALNCLVLVRLFNWLGFVWRNRVFGREG